MTTNEKMNIEKANNFEKELYKALKASGFDLIKTDEEVKDYIENFGETKIELPESLGDANTLFKKLLTKIKGVSQEKESYAFAARGQRSAELPDSVLQKMKDEIKNGKRVKGKKSKNGRK